MMTKVLNEVLTANRDYVASFDKGDLPLPPGRHFAILTCMDARLDPAKYAGLSEGDAHVIRNAGGGMELFSDEIMRDLLASSLKTASIDASGWHDCCEGPGSAEAKYIDWLTIKDQAQSVLEDVVRIKSHPLVPSDIPVYGYIYDVKSGKLIEVPEATAAGK
jgi:carbonic anhydrase